MNSTQTGKMSKLRILIIEDHAPTAMLLLHLLSRAGCDVLAAHTGKRGMELAQENKFDLITLDVDLPDANGFEICGELKQRHHSRHTPVVFISGRSDAKNQLLAFDLGAADFIAKPVKATGFVSRIFSHIKPKAAYA